MNLFEGLRNKAFWTLDKIKGNVIKNHIDDIDFIINNFENNLTTEKLQNRLKELLHHAALTTKFYIEHRSKLSIENFPVVDKNTIRANINEFVSDKFKPEELIPAVTSGSTGTPFKVFHSKAKKHRNYADTIYFAGKAGYKPGKKLYVLKIWSDNNKRNPLQLFSRNMVPVDVLELNSKCGSVLKDFNANKSPVNFLGYVSALETLCKYLDAHSQQYPNLKADSIITMSESLNEYTKTSLDKYFSCQVFSRYSNIENGIIAQQIPGSANSFVLNTASYLTEVFDMHKDVPLVHGQLGRIVVTDYYNYAMPMIRYDTGDVGSMDYKEVNGKKQLVLTHVEGRKLDQIYNTRGELLSSYIVYKNMWKYTEIEQYQLVQKGEREYTFKICMQGDFLREDELVREFNGFLGDDAVFNVEYVKEIPLLNSGKRKKVVNLMNQTQ